MADISKIRLASGDVVNLKDKAGRTDFATLLGDNTLAALQTAAWKAAQATWDASTTAKQGELPTVGAVKSYVDAQIESIPTFEVVVCPAVAAQIPAGAKYYDASTTPVTEITGTMAASADTYRKIYLVKNDKAQSGAYVEYITIRSGAEGSYTYSWEQIGSTVIDLSNYVTKTTELAGVAIGNGIAKADLQDALDLDSLAYKASANGSYTPEGTVADISYTPEGSITVNALTQTETAASLTKGDFTPSGSITGSAIDGGSIEVTVKDATSGTAVTDITYESYTPEGTIAANGANGAFAALTSATFEADASGVAVTGTISKPNITVTAGSKKTFVTGLNGGSVASFTEGAFTAASIDAGKFFSAGTLPTKAADTFNAGSFTKGTAVNAATEGIVASINASAQEGDEEFELLMFANAATDAVMDHDATFVAPEFTEGSFSQGTLPSIDVANGFNGGSKAADSFTANVLQGVDTGDVHDTPTAVLANAPEFTGDKFRVAVESDTALKEVAFTGTAADVKMNGAKYLKQEIDTATFTGNAATLGFSGTKAESVLVTAVKYDKAAANGATFAGNGATLSTTFAGNAATITVE